MIRLAAAGLAALALISCRKPPAPGEPLAGLSAAERARFDSGKVVFDSVFTPEKGLGPLFNANACAECHEDPVAGGTGDEVERHATAFHPDATGRACDELPGLGPGQKGWRLAARDKLNTKEAREYAAEARQALDRLIAEHKGTPWAVLAKRERLTALGLEWQATSFGE